MGSIWAWGQVSMKGDPFWTPWGFSINRVHHERRKYRSLGDSEILAVANRLRLLRMSGGNHAILRFQTLALATEVIARETGKELRRCQLSGAIGLTRRVVIEMQTGEGKTLTGVPAVAYLAFAGKGCHVVTSNGYLASRDAESLRPIYERLGLSVACVTADSDQEHRGSAYSADITFGTASEFGFDFLRDCLVEGPQLSGVTSEDSNASDRVHRGFHAAVIDEADSVLIDEASTPLIIGAEIEASEAYKVLYRWADRCSCELEPSDDFILEPAKLTAHLTEQGARKVVLHQRPPIIDTIGSEEILEQVERSIVAHRIISRERDYLVDDGKLVLVSGSTGRRLDGRKWQRGLHQAIEAKEKIEISNETRTTARITVQEYFNLYDHLSGMTGTARSAKGELRKFYRLRVKCIPTNKPCQRVRHKPLVYRTLAEKHAAIAQQVKDVNRAGRSVLIGTPSVEASESLASHFRDIGVDFRLLNANQDKHEAQIIADAGRGNAVTIATNMAGRGTDIELTDEVRSAGGLHVIATEIHSSRRIDRQLEGRCARQGDPGSYQIIVSYEDELWLSSGRQPAKTWHILPTSRFSLAPFLQVQSKLQRASRKSRLRMYKASKQHRKRLLDAGFDLFLEMTES